MNSPARAILAVCLCSAAMLSATLLSGCKSSPATTAQADARATASATPEQTPGVSLTGLRIVLPRVADRPAALYFQLANGGTRRATLVGVYVDGATKADMHETVGDAMKPLTKVVLDPGATVAFAPGGKHVMLYRIPGTWKGSDHPAVTLKFADGDKISGKAEVQKAQTAQPEPEAMPGMKM